MKRKLITSLFICFFFMTHAQQNEIRLIIRSDDLGSFHAANLGCIQTYTNGITQSVELMPPCPWFYEAVEMVNDYPELDVGIHLTLTSEWSKYKWRPITNCPGLTDEAGNFYPMVWKNDNFPEFSSIQESDWNIDEIEQELRAQIELSLKHVPHISHLTSHMGFEGLDAKITNLMKELAKEYKLDVDLSSVKRFPRWDQEKPIDTRLDQFCDNLNKLAPGTYIFVEHPAKDFPEMRPISHVGSYHVAQSREMVTRILTSRKVKRIIHKSGIKLIAYKDLKD